MNKLVNRTKKYFYIAIPFLVFSLANFTQAQEGILNQLNETGSAAGYDTSAKADITLMVGTVIRSLLGIVGTLFMALIIYAGVIWMTAQGNDDKVAKAKKILSNSVIGLIIVIISYFMVEFLFDVIIQATKTNSGGAV